MWLRTEYNGVIRFTDINKVECFVISKDHNKALVKAWLSTEDFIVSEFPSVEQAEQFVRHLLRKVTGKPTTNADRYMHMADDDDV